MKGHDHEGEREPIWPNAHERRLFRHQLGAAFHPSASRRADHEAAYRSLTTPEREKRIREEFEDTQRSAQERSQWEAAQVDRLTPRVEWGKRHDGDWLYSEPGASR